MATASPELERPQLERKRSLKKGLGVAAVTVAGATAAWLVFRRWHTHWGATREESAGSLPGDELIPEAESSVTHAITIDAPVDCVWPWLAQLGQSKGGFYSYTFLENLVGCEMQNADVVHPEWQEVAVGDPVYFHPKFPPGTVQDVRPERYMVLEWKMGDQGHGTWVFVLRALGYDKTRLLVRARSHPAKGLGRLAEEFLGGPAHFVMERKMMLTVKKLAEDLAFHRRIVEDDIC